MKSPKARDTGVFVLILIMSLVISILGNALIDGIYRWVYPEKHHSLVEKYANKYSVPIELVFAVIKVESNFETDVVSSAGALGLMQMLPSTYEWLASRLGDEPNEELLYDPETNIRYGTYYLQYLYARFGTWEKAIIAYNWGEGNFSNFINENGYTDGDYDSIPIKETRNYVKKVIHHWEKYKELY